MKCFLDMDGVLVDFVGGCLKTHQKPNPYDIEENLGEWEISKLIGLSDNDFWAALDSAWWSSLNWTSDGKAILALIEKYFDSVCLLTHPYDDRSVNGKFVWIENNLSKYKHNYAMSPMKSFFAHKDVVLIDDRDQNVEEFELAGGKAILIPRPWNKRHQESNEVLDCIEWEIGLLENWKYKLKESKP